MDVFEHVEITLATENDFSDIINLMSKNKYVFSEKEISSAAKFLKNSINNKQYFLIKNKYSLLGCGGYVEYDDTDGVFELSFLVVHPEMINKGIGTKLLKYIEYIISHKNARLLIAHAGENERNRYFYIARGFETAGTIPKYYNENKGMITYFKKY